MTPLTVTAHLEAGLAHAGPWGIALDGLLASQLHAGDIENAGIRVMEDPAPQSLELPLARCGTGRDWHWAATCSWPVDGHGHPPQVAWWISRADQNDLVDVAERCPQTISELKGRYRRYRMPLLVTACTAVTWRAIGDPDRISELLTTIPAIGKKRTSGHGRVTAWEITTEPALDRWDAAHTHPDGTLGRTTPAACLDGHAGVIDAGAGPAGLRPPYMHPHTQRPRLRLPTHPSSI